MRMFGYSLYLFYLYFVAMGCASQQSATTAQDGKYTEDISVLRPKIEATPTAVSTDTSVTPVTTDERKATTYVEPKYAVNKKLDTVLDSIDRINLSRKYVEGFTIQVYSGKREDALNTKRQLASLMPDLTAEVQFTEPIFRVKAGKYYNRLDAQRDYTVVKKHFPSAIIIPEKIAIN